MLLFSAEELDEIIHAVEDRRYYFEDFERISAPAALKTAKMKLEAMLAQLRIKERTGDARPPLD